MSDLVRRIWNHLNGDTDGSHPRQLLREAADRIEELEAEVERLKNKKCVHDLAADYSRTVTDRPMFLEPAAPTRVPVQYAEDWDLD